jgi:hypothetical protein
MSDRANNMYPNAEARKWGYIRSFGEGGEGGDDGCVMKECQLQASAFQHPTVTRSQQQTYNLNS